jgi:hypothetical protein
MISAILIIFGLALFETVSSVDNAIINAQVLSTMGQRARRWFLIWGILIAVFLIRGLLPLLIVWLVNPSLGPIGALIATFSGDPQALQAIESSSALLLMGGGTFLLFLFSHWLFLEQKEYGLPHEAFIYKYGFWFYAAASVMLAVIVWLALKRDPMLAFGAVIGSTAFFITHGFKEQAESKEHALLETNNHTSDFSKILYLEAIDATFSIDGVLGAFAFTLSVPLILLGNGIGAILVRQLTVGNIERVKRYPLLKNAAMYSVFILGLIMVVDGFGGHIPEWLSPIATVLIVLFFIWRSGITRRLSKTGENLTG